MDNQKDKQKTSLNSYGQGNVPDIKTLNSKHPYEFANKKTEKLVTALYMVTDCMDTDDALKIKLRQLGVELLSDMYKLSLLSPTDKQVHISSSLSHVEEVLSFVEIAYTIGFISEMNTNILKKEFLILVGELDSHQKKDKHFTFTLDEQMFNSPQIGPMESNLQARSVSLRDITSEKNKRTNYNNMSFTNLNPNNVQNKILKTSNHVASVSEKNDRIDRILAITKDKEVSIKDISVSFKDCSEKTIQRELNSLVLKGQIKKTGEKRWSRYKLVPNK